MKDLRKLNLLVASTQNVKKKKEEEANKE